MSVPGKETFFHFFEQLTRQLTFGLYTGEGIEKVMGEAERSLVLGEGILQRCDPELSPGRF